MYLYPRTTTTTTTTRTSEIIKIVYMYIPKTSGILFTDLILNLKGRSVATNQKDASRLEFLCLAHS